MKSSRDMSFIAGETISYARALSGNRQQQLSGARQVGYEEGLGTYGTAGMVDSGLYRDLAAADGLWLRYDQLAGLGRRDWGWGVSGASRVS